MIAGFQPERAQQLRAVVRRFLELAIGHRLAGPGHLIGDLVRLGPRVVRRMNDFEIPEAINVVVPA